MNQQYETVRVEAKTLLDSAKEQYSQLDPALVPEFKEVTLAESGRLFPKNQQL